MVRSAQIEAAQVMVPVPDDGLMMTLSVAVGTPAPPPPPEESDQLVVVVVFHVPLPPTQ